MLLKIKCFWKLIFLRSDYSILPLNHSRTTNKKRPNKFYLTRILSHPNFIQTFYPIVEIFVTSSSHNRSLILSIWLKVSLLSEDKGSFGIGLCIFQLGFSIVKVPLMLVHGGHPLHLLHCFKGSWIPFGQCEYFIQFSMVEILLWPKFSRGPLDNCSLFVALFH